jgi:hypothetical protein
MRSWQYELKGALLEALPGEDYKTAATRIELFLEFRRLILAARLALGIEAPAESHAK